MRKSCKYCGRTHPVGYVCPMKPRYDKPRKNKIDKFRRTDAWREVRQEALERDMYKCVLCEAEKLPRRYNKTNLSVHHIVPIAEDWHKRLECDNLITLCSKHHAQAEKGTYSREFLQNLIKK